MNDLSRRAIEIQEKLRLSNAEHTGINWFVSKELKCAPVPTASKNPRNEHILEREETDGVGETRVSGEHAVEKGRLQPISKLRALSQAQQDKASASTVTASTLPGAERPLRSPVKAEIPREEFSIFGGVPLSESLNPAAHKLAKGKAEKLAKEEAFKARKAGRGCTQSKKPKRRPSKR